MAITQSFEELSYGSLHRALGDAIPPHLRAVAARFVYPMIDLRFLYARVTPEDGDNTSGIATEVVADFFLDVHVNEIVEYYPLPYCRALFPGEFWMYARGENTNDALATACGELDRSIPIHGQSPQGQAWYAANSALLDRVSPRLRAVAYGFDGRRVTMRCLYEDVSESDRSDVASIEARVETDLADTPRVEVSCWAEQLSIGQPRVLNPDETWAFERREW
ncbi:MAG: hypothetical protein FWF36_08035 [Propionibacteriaceae bacterium]|nr:hypothetical protein [Propionibacteriaceae bacterium]